MAKLVEAGADYLQLLGPLNLISCKVQKSVTKKKLEKLINITTNTDYLKTKLETNSIANQFIEMQKIWQFQNPLRWGY